MSKFPPVILTQKRKRKNETNDYLFDFKVLKAGNEKGSIKSISICNKYIAIGCNNMVLLHSITGENLNKKYKCTESISKLKFRDDKMLGIGLENGNIELIGLFCFDRIKSMCGHKSAVNDLIFSSNFQHLYSCSRDFTIKIWNIWEGSCEHTLDYHIDNITSICLYTFNNNSNSHLISSSYDGYVYFYDLNLNKNINKIELEEPIECLNIFKNEYIVLSVKNVIKFYTLEKLEFVKDLIISPKTCFHLTSFKHFLVVASLDLSVYFLDPFYKGTKKIKVVSIANFLNSPKSAEFSNGVLVLGEMNGKWLIEVYNEKAKKKKIKHKDSRFIIDIQEETFSYTDEEINQYLKTFKYNEALIRMIKKHPDGMLSLLDYLSKHKVLIQACRTYSIEDTIKVLAFFRKKFVIDVLMFEFFFSFFRANKWIATTRNAQVLDELNGLKRGFENTQKFMKYYQNLKDIADFLKN
ncbi:hypothetical protein, conserved [Plasmodium gonderi]|uniref:Uncharacterized protein n=1 Tax=Plasmodium gonderi TaxID=77519 RepID=A0A1Y1JPR2_PLAGO|nr:hypothetical protein, conserved [Plasmodium gonderi]GAW82054.1 hypothetical protein, conserved [Plasmodium gonderi]